MEQKNTFNNYQIFAKESLLDSLKTNMTVALQRISLWTSTECGEVIDSHLKSSTLGHRDQDKEVNIKDFILELGDCIWCVTEMCSLNNISLDTVARENIKKIYNRYLEESEPNISDDFSWEEYENHAKKTVQEIPPINGETKQQAYLNVSLLGIQKELGQFTAEINDHLIQKRIGKESELNKQTLIERAGDTLWYCSLACNCVSYTMDQLINLNKEKLSQRYLKAKGIDD